MRPAVSLNRNMICRFAPLRCLPNKSHAFGTPARHHVHIHPLKCDDDNKTRTIDKVVFSFTVSSMTFFYIFLLDRLSRPCCSSSPCFAILRYYSSHHASHHSSFTTHYHVHLFYIPPSNSLTAADSSQLCFSNAFLALLVSNPISHTRAMASSLLPCGLAYVSVQNFAVLSNLGRSLRYILAT